MSVLAFDSLEWHSAAMPGSSGPVDLARLPQLDDQAFRAFVRFPVGWSRPGAGHYAVPEEFLILDGDLSLNGITWKTGGYAWIPARRARSRSSSAGGCLAFAWFGGLPRWVASEPAAPASEADVSFMHWREAPQRAIGESLNARELRGGSKHSTWLVEQATPDIFRKLGASHEALRLRDRAWICDGPIAPSMNDTSAWLVRIPGSRSNSETG